MTSEGPQDTDPSPEKPEGGGEPAFSRRDLITGSTGLVAGGAAVAVFKGFASPAPKSLPVAPAPPLPWKWVEIDPLEAGRRAYQMYFDPVTGGCGSGAYVSILSILKEKVGYPWTTLPDMMMSHAAAGYGGHGTLCGSLGGASAIINLVAWEPKRQVFRQIIDRLYDWYAIQEFPTNRFDDISQRPGQIKVRAMTPLCHTSVSKWAHAAGAEIKSREKKERCAKVCGDVVFMIVLALNEFSAGRWTPPRWEPSEAIKKCIECHRPDAMLHSEPPHSKPGLNTVQGHMNCLLCHDDHTK